jgi:hypothetical protein
MIKIVEMDCEEKDSKIIISMLDLDYLNVFVIELSN